MDLMTTAFFCQGKRWWRQPYVILPPSNSTSVGELRSGYTSRVAGSCYQRHYWQQLTVRASRGPRLGQPPRPVVSLQREQKNTNQALARNVRRVVQRDHNLLNTVENYI